MRTGDWLTLHEEEDQLLLTRAAREKPNKDPTQKNKARVNLRSSPKTVRKIEGTLIRSKNKIFHLESTRIELIHGGHRPPSLI
jgi:hypothetical protein